MAQAFHAFSWLARSASPEWVQLLAGDMFGALRARGLMRELRRMIAADAFLQSWLAEHERILEL